MTSERDEYSIEPLATDFTEVEATPRVTEEPVTPVTLDEAGANEIKNQANSVVDNLVGATGVEELEAFDGIATVGLATERRAASQLGHMKSRVAEYLGEGGSSKQIANGLVDLRMNLDQLNPSSRANQPAWERALSYVPLVSGNRGPVRMLKRISAKYEPVSVQVDRIESNLREGREMLMRDNVQLRKLYAQIVEHRTKVQHAAYFCELVAFNLSNRIDEVEDQVKRSQLEEALTEVVTRVEDLRSMELVHAHYLFSIDMTRRNNRRLGHAVDRTLTMATNVVIVGLAIQAAMVRQRGVMEQTTLTNKFVGEIITRNAEAVKQHTAEIGDLYSNPVIALNKIAKAQDDLVAALDTAVQQRREGLAKATSNVAELARLTEEFHTRVANSLGNMLPESAELGRQLPGSV